MFDYGQLHRSVFLERKCNSRVALMYYRSFLFPWIYYLLVTIHLLSPKRGGTGQSTLMKGINQHFQTKEVGQCDTLPGTLSGKAFSIFCMKEENYTMKLMATYGVFVEIDGSKTLKLLTAVNGEKFIKSFNYTETFHNIFKFCHQVGDHNNSRHSPLSLGKRVGLQQIGSTRCSHS